MQIGFRSPGRLRALTWARVLLATAVVSLATGGLALAAKHGHKPRHGKAPHGRLSITPQSWGTADGKPVSLYTLRNSHGMVVKISNYGGVVQSIKVPDRNGTVRNVALGFSTLDDYVNDFEHQPWPAAGGSGDTYFGAIIGRYANRIAGAKFSLNGNDYPLGSGPPCPATPTPNNGPNLLHGGPNSYNTQVWTASTSTTANAVSLILTYTDVNCKNGFPGDVQNTVTYTLNQNNALRISYKATTDAPTIVNFTNHTYFNLGGQGSGDIYGEKLALNSNTFTPVDSNLIPTGVFAPVAGTPFDFRAMKPIGRDIRKANLPEGSQLTIAHGYDHNWVLNGYPGYRLVAVAQDPSDGIVLWTYTTEPGVQVYTGNFLVGDLVGTSGRAYRQGDAFTLETQHYPDSPHHMTDSQWPSVVLNPGQVFQSTTTYKFTTAGRSFRHNFK
jgi:aldose 1-epimerase